MLNRTELLSSKHGFNVNIESVYNLQKEILNQKFSKTCSLMEKWAINYEYNNKKNVEFASPYFSLATALTWY